MTVGNCTAIEQLTPKQYKHLSDCDRKRIGCWLKQALSQQPNGSTA